MNAELNAENCWHCTESYVSLKHKITVKKIRNLYTEAHSINQGNNIETNEFPIGCLCTWTSTIFSTKSHWASFLLNDRITHMHNMLPMMSTFDIPSRRYSGVTCLLQYNVFLQCLLALLSKLPIWAQIIKTTVTIVYRENVKCAKFLAINTDISMWYIPVVEWPTFESKAHMEQLFKSTEAERAGKIVFGQFTNKTICHKSSVLKS